MKRKNSATKWPLVSISVLSILLGLSFQSPAASAEPVHINWGTYTSAENSPHGIYAKQTALKDLRTTEAALEAPTLLPAGDPCIEATTLYLPSGAWIEAFDWCALDSAGEPGKVGKKLDMNSAGGSKYIKDENYEVELLQTDPSDNTWTMYLYNYTTSTWDAFYTSRGHDPNLDPDPSKNPGWSKYEIWSDDQSTLCDDMKGRTISSTNIQQRYDSGWQVLNDDNTYSYDPSDSQFLGCDSLAAYYQSPTSYDWMVSG